MDNYITLKQLRKTVESLLLKINSNKDHYDNENLTIRNSIPTKTSDIINDSNYQTSTQVNSAIASAIGDINEFEVAIVTDLPTTDIDTHTIYFKSNSSSGNNVYDEYMYINNNWELIGSTAIDLSNYVEKDKSINNDARQTHIDTSIDPFSSVTQIQLEAEDHTDSSNHKYSNLIVGTSSGIIMASTEGVSIYNVVTPTDNAMAANKKYVDDSVSAISVPTKTSDLTNDSGYITSYTETDPTVPEWAKAATKPTYTASEVGAIENNTNLTLGGSGYILFKNRQANKATLSNSFSASSDDSNSTIQIGYSHQEDGYKGLLKLSNTALAKGYTTITPTATSNISINLPSTAGTLALTSQIPAAQVQSDWNATSGMGVILNKPTIPAATTVTQTLTSGTKIGEVNGISLYAPEAGSEGITTETDPIFSASPAAGITSENITAWNAKSNFSGSYNDLSDKPTIPTVPTNVSAFTNDSGYLTSYTETDPTVPAWAKAESKPTYTAAEVGAASASDLNNYVPKYSGTGTLDNDFVGTIITNENNIISLSYIDSSAEESAGIVIDQYSGVYIGASSNYSVSISSLVDPTFDTDAANKRYVDNKVANLSLNKLQTTAGVDNTEYNLIGTATTNTNTSAVNIYQPTLLSFSKYANNFARLTIGSTTTPGVVRIYTSADSASGFTDIQSSASSTNERTVTFPDASGTVALTSDLSSYVKEHISNSSASGAIHNSSGNIYLSTTTSRTNSSKIDLNGSTIKIKSWSGTLQEPSTSVIEITPTTTTIKNVVTPTENGDAVNKEYVDGLVSGMLHYKGTKATVSALPSSGNTTGDVWHITADGSEWAWDGSSWQELGTTVDLSGYVPSSRTVNGKALTSNISLDASDVSALPASTTYVSTFNGQSGAITYTPPVTSVNEQTGAVTITASSISAASVTHAHGNITSGGDMTTTAAIASGDRLVINDESASKLTSSTITFGSSTTQYLANNGTWQNIPATYDDTALAARVTALEQIPWVTYYTGSSTPSNSQGNNGDLYFQTAQ